MKQPLGSAFLTAKIVLPVFLLAGTLAQAQFAHFDAPPIPAPLNQPEAIARVLELPNQAQSDAVRALSSAVEPAEQNAASARLSLVQAAFGRESGSLAGKLAALAAAELELAQVRAGELTKLQAGPEKLSPAQLEQLRGKVQAALTGGSRPTAGGYPADLSSVIGTLPGFKVEIVASSDVPIQGSWISLTQDDQGRIILGANEQQPLTRLTLDAAGKVIRNETLYTPVSEAMGMEWHGYSLYVAGGRDPKDALVRGKPNPSYCCESGTMGLHRFTDLDGDGKFEYLQTLRTWTGNEQGHSDHGAHAPKVSPDGKYLYTINGNGVSLPEDLEPDSPVRNLADDRIIPLIDGTGGIGKARNPSASGPGGWGFGGYVMRTDFDGKHPYLMVMGLRNALHIDYNADGEMFTYDSDHEPELGVPWYRPTRVLWAPMGANFGHRRDSSSGKYPAWWEDATPALLDVGLGSPVGVAFGYHTKFPAVYQRALFLADNNYGRIMAVHMRPVGSGYTVVSMDNVVWPKSLYTNNVPQTTHNITDLMVARDGTFYYVIGNRSTQAYLMRLVYNGPVSTEPVPYVNTVGAKEREIRHSLEAFHWQSGNPEAVNAAWAFLGSDDRPIRYAARVALETVSPTVWKARALAEKVPQKAIIALLALARVGGVEANEDIFAALAKFPLSSLPDSIRLQKLRVIQVAASRNGRPSDEAVKQVISDIDNVYPANTFELNTDMSQILAAFNAPTVAVKTMSLAQATANYQENFEYRYNLRFLTNGWTTESRLAYFQWFQDPSRGREDFFNDTYWSWFVRVGRKPGIAGNDAPFNKIRSTALATLTEAEKADPQLVEFLAEKRGGK